MVDATTPKEACEGLVTLALERGGLDNVTVLVVWAEDDEEAPKGKKKT